MSHIHASERQPTNLAQESIRELALTNQQGIRKILGKGVVVNARYI